MQLEEEALLLLIRGGVSKGEANAVLLEANAQEMDRTAAMQSDDASILDIASIPVKSQDRSALGGLTGWPLWAAAQPQRHLEVQVINRTDTDMEDIRCTQLKIVSWNVLSPTWFRTGNNFPHVAPGDGEWDARRSKIVAWLYEMCADVINLQEVDFDQFDSIVALLNAEGGGVMQRAGGSYCGVMQRMNGDTTKQPCGVATLYNTRKLELVQSDVKHSSRGIVTGFKLITTEFGGQGEGGSDLCARERGSDLCAGEGGSDLDVAEGGSDLAVINVHLESSQTGCKERARQLNTPLKFVAMQMPGAAVLLSGKADSNTYTDS
jgi:hypothetical protein